MTYGIKRCGTWKSGYWQPEVSKRIHFTSSSDEYSDLDEALFKHILKEELDVPEYKITEENIKKEYFDCSCSKTKIPDECVKRIAAYHKWRADLFRKICKQLLSAKAKKLLEQLGVDEIKFRYYIPAEYNNFSTEDPNYTGGQMQAYLEIAVYR